jgi:hypothetical protein
MNELQIQMYGTAEVYLEGWYSIAELQEVIKTMEGINEVNRMMLEEDKPDPFTNTMLKR